MRLILPLLALGAFSTPAAATDLFVGVHAHGLPTPLSLEADREGGVDLSAGIRGKSIGRLFGRELQPYAFASVNTRGDTSFVAAGLSTRFGRKLYVRPGLGVAIHDGSAANFTRRDRLAFGSRILFEPEIAVGAELNERVSVEASWVHLSHAQLFGTQNPGIDNIGLRLNWRL